MKLIILLLTSFCLACGLADPLALNTESPYLDHRDSPSQPSTWILQTNPNIWPPKEGEVGLKLPADGSDGGFVMCQPNKKDKKMCMLGYVERNTWGGWGAVMVLDHMCNILGKNDHVARNWLAGRWSFQTSLPYLVDIRISNEWNENNVRGVEIWYGNKYLEPFWKPLYDLGEYELKTTLKTNDPNAWYAAFRTPFRCA